MTLMKNHCGSVLQTLVSVGYEQTDPSLLVGWNTNQTFCQRFASEMLPTCQVKVQIALEFSKLSISIFKILFYV